MVFEAGKSDNFSLEVELVYPPLTVTYVPGFWQLVKFAWIQYLSIVLLFWLVLRNAQDFVFKNQIILTSRETQKFHQS